VTRRSASRRVQPRRIVIWLLALLLAVVSSAPIVWAFLTSFKSFVQANAKPPVWIPDFHRWKNWEDQFGPGGAAVGPLLNSLTVATATMIVTMLVAIPAAYALARYGVRRKSDIQFWIISSRMMPLIAAIVPLSTMLVWLNLNNTLQGLVIVYVAFNLSFAIWLLTIFFSNVPIEIEEAARIDGVSRMGVLWHITFPLARAGLVVIAIFTWIFAWNELLAAIVVTTGQTETLPVYLSGFASNNMTQYEKLAAVGVAQVIPAILIVFFAQRYIVAGMSMGAVSGE
jgi:ABC-type glycerol-3-phosphate transport system permease component